jgi:high-affinity iron transporter
MTRMRLQLIAALVLTGLLLGSVPAPAGAQGSVSRDDAIAQLRTTTLSIDRTLDLLKQGRRAEAFRISRSGYLDHFEVVEIPLRAADPGLTLAAEESFAEIRSAIRLDAPTQEIRDRIVDLRGQVADAERRLTDKGLGAPSLVFGQAFLIVLREGLEAVLLLAVLFAYLESTKNGRYKRHIAYGVGAAAVATLASVFAVNALFDLLPFGREVLEAIVALSAVVVLFYVSFWLIARLEQRRWLEFLKARVWTAISAGSAASLVAIGFTSVYREGFETVLFFQALTSFGEGLTGYVAAGAAAGAAVLAAIATAILRYGRRLPVRTFLAIAVSLVMATSVAFLGNAVSALQAADVLSYDRLESWPHLPIFLAQATGYSPTAQTVLAQAALTAIYALGALWVFVLRPLRHQRTRPHAPARTAVELEAP